MKNLLNFCQLSEYIGTAGQPTVEQLRLIAEQDYTAVINLAMHDFQGVLDMLERLQDEVPEYTGLRRELWTSSRNFCGWTRRWCVGPYPFEDLTRGTPEFRRARDLQRRNQELEKETVLWLIIPVIGIIIAVGLYLKKRGIPNQRAHNL